ncbi:MAG: N-acetylmuramoyl-L-alanine amidase [Frankiales bacterium]|nr:N-acetylmuramoyl-L-alanine amidase [Frankiales bacterium]
MRRSRLLIAVVTAVALVPFLPPAEAASGPVITVLSGRADLVSAGDALVQVDQGARLSVNGHDVTRTFRNSSGHLIGLVSGLHLGDNTLTARAAGRSSSITLTNHPIGGPVFSGPQILPWACAAGTTGPQCNKKPVYSFKYLPAGISLVPGQAVGNQTPLQDYDPASPPPSPLIASTTTQTGVTVPFIVRQETGYLDRDEYRIAALYQPGKPWDGSRPQPQFNHKLVLTHGASCDTEYKTASAPDVLNITALGAGFAVASHALDNAGHNCNIITQAESLVMTKERVIEQYGTLRYTIGSGCSGGSLVQQQVANAYPGVYQGISPQCSFTDAWSSAQQYLDYVMLLAYFKDPSRWTPGTVWDPLAISQVLGHPNVANPVTFTTAIPNSGDPSRSCAGVPADKVFDPQTNPRGVKCTLQDYMVNVFGKRPDGFANRAFSNVGIQYGLVGLRKGLISPAQFVDLNNHLGGVDINGDISPNRIVPDLAGLKRVYTSGAANTATNLNKVAIIDLRGPDPGAFHDVYRTYAMRARLLRNFGTAANQVLWRGQVPLLGDVNYVDQAILALDKWLGRIDADGRNLPLATKVIADKPGDVIDRCTNGAGVDIPSEVCDETVAAYATPRIASGGPVADDTLACSLKPLRRDDYSVAFTDGQWAVLRVSFPHGVCDYSKPSIAFHGVIPWQTYQDKANKVVYGGKPLGPAPVSR